MARAKRTPADELAELDQRIVALDQEGEQLSTRRGEAEALLRSYQSRREDALTLRKLGETVEVPDESEPARLQRLIADAKAEEEAVRRARQRLKDERYTILGAGLA